MAVRLTLVIILEEKTPAYPNAVACLKRDLEACLTFYALPKAHWQKIRYRAERDLLDRRRRDPGLYGVRAKTGNWDPVEKIGGGKPMGSPESGCLVLNTRSLALILVLLLSAARIDDPNAAFQLAPNNKRSQK